MRTTETDIGMKDFTAYAIGFCAASICTSLPIEEAIEHMNFEHPTGISSQWRLDNAVTFKGDESNPCPCNDNPLINKHYLLIC